MDKIIFDESFSANKELKHQKNMLVTDEILFSFINCHYKAYLKSRQQSGITSEFEMLYNKTKKIQKDSFEKKLSESGMLHFKNISNTRDFQKEGASLNAKFTNSNINIVLDGIEFTGKKSINAIFISPFEKVKKADKLFVALQATFIQDNFSVQVESCKVIFGQSLKETKFKLSSIAKTIKKSISELNKIVSTSIAPTFFKNIHCQTCEFQSNCLKKLIERDDLSLLAGLKPKEIIEKNNRGIFSVKQLSYLFRPKNPYNKRSFVPKLKALAIRENKTFIQAIPEIKKVETEVFMDFEGILDRNSNYRTIGVA